MEIKSELLPAVTFMLMQSPSLGFSQKCSHPQPRGPEADPCTGPRLYLVHQLPACLHLPFRFLRQDLIPTLLLKTVGNTYQVHRV